MLATALTADPLHRPFLGLLDPVVRSLVPLDAAGPEDDDDEENDDDEEDDEDEDQEDDED